MSRSAPTRVGATVTHIGERALFMVNSQDDLQTLATLAIAGPTARTQARLSITPTRAGAAAVLDPLYDAATLPG